MQKLLLIAGVVAFVFIGATEIKPDAEEPAACECLTWLQGAKLEVSAVDSSVTIKITSANPEVQKQLQEFVKKLIRAAEAKGKTPDPVCGMEVRIDEAMVKHLTVEYQGNTYYFCSAQCRTNFLKQPQKYLSSSQQKKSCPGCRNGCH